MQKCDKTAKRRYFHWERHLFNNPQVVSMHDKVVFIIQTKNLLYKYKL